MRKVNWKTSLAGIGMILVSIYGIVMHFIGGTVIDVPRHVAEIVGGLGLIAAQDAEVWKGRDSMTNSERGKGYHHHKAKKEK